MNKVRALLLAQLENSMIGLREHGARDRAVHGVRKELKRARASLRLLRKCVGRDGYRRHNLALRDAARQLAAVRDARAALHAFSSLKSPEDSGGARTFGQCVLRALQGDWRESRTRLHARAGVYGSVEDVKRGIARLKSGDLDRASVGAGVARVYREGQRAFAEVRKRRTDEHLHELRKQAKYLFNQIESVSRMTGGRLTAIRKQSDRLADCLGEDHDFALLHRRIGQISAAQGLALDSGSVAPWVERIQERRTALQREARSLAKRLYTRRVAELRAKIGGKQ